MARGDDGGHTEARIAELDGRRRARNAYALAIGLSGVTGATAVPLLLSNVDTQAGERHHVLGVRPDDLLGQASFDVMNPEDLPRATADFADALARGKARGTYRCRDKDGRERWIESVYDAVPRGERTFIAVAARDVTENRALAAQLQQSQKMDALGRMAAVVAHDFNNLLTVIRSAITLALWELTASSSSRGALLQAEQATIGAAALTARLLAFSRGAVVSLEVVDARQALSGLAELLPRALGSSIELDVQLAPDLPPIVAAPVHLEQILLNLAINARDAMPDGGKVSVVARSRHLAEGEERDCRSGEWLELDVKDTGSGLSDDVKAHLFEPFFTTKPPGQGTGLGLSTCYGIVRQLSRRQRARPGDHVHRAASSRSPRAARRRLTFRLRPSGNIGFGYRERNRIFVFKNRLV